MKKKEIDWSFWMKIVISGLGMILLLTFLLGGKAFQKKDDEQQQQKGRGEKSSRKTNPREPFRTQIMSMNTITLFFLLMSINEYRVNEFTSPFGVDPDKIPKKCKLHQESYYWIIFLLCLTIVGYNYLILFFTLARANSRNIIVEKTSSSDKYRDKYYRASSGDVETLIKSVNRLNPKNGMFVVEIYPYFIEFMFFMMLAFFSIIIYIFFVLSNYSVIENKLFKPCANPLNNDRFYDPFAKEETTDNDEYY